MNANEQAVAAVLAKYEDALNQSDIDAVMELYAFDGVFMPQNSPSSRWTAIGNQVRTAQPKSPPVSTKKRASVMARMVPV